MSKRATLPSRKRKTCPTVLSLSPCVCPWSGLPSRSRTDCFCDDRSVGSPVEAHRLDVRTDDGPLARPVLPHGLAAVNVAPVHAIGPDDIIGKHSQHAVDVSHVEAIIDALEDFDITDHWVLSLMCRASPITSPQLGALPSCQACPALPSSSGARRPNARADHTCRI